MQYNGLQRDTRGDSEKASDFFIEEIQTAAGSAIFEERDPVGFTVRNQDGSGSCVAQTAAKMLEVWDYYNDNETTVYSATPIYKNRSNKPTPGMNWIEGISFSVKNGCFLESEVPSQNMSDEQMDRSANIARRQKLYPTHYAQTSVDFESVARAVQSYKAVMLWFKSSYIEWNQSVPSGDSDSETVRHSVCCVDSISFEGKRYLIIEDSWGEFTDHKPVKIPLKKGQRAITEEFFKKHCFLAGVYVQFSFEGIDKPVFTFTKRMNFGDNHEQVKKLQDVLKYEKFFPSNVESTGYFGSITAKAVKKWQLAHGIYDFETENDMRKIKIGPKSIDVLNALYSLM